MIFAGGEVLSVLFSPIKDFFKKGDVILLGLCLAASGFGLVLIFSATQYLGETRWIRFVSVQLIAILLGVVAYMLLTFVDFQLFVEKRWKLLLAFNIIFLLLLLTPLGEDLFPAFPWTSSPTKSSKYPLF